MDTTREDLNLRLYQKLADEQQQYKDWLLTQPPEDILKNAYDYTIREDIVFAMEGYDLPDDQAQALLHSPSPLAEIVQNHESTDSNYMDHIRSCIENRANEILDEQAEALRTLPVYTKTAAYAKEHGEQEAYRKSMEANIQCRTAIEDAIHAYYHDNRLDPAGAKEVLARFGTERTCYVLSATVQNKDWDGRISSKNKEWAKQTIIPQEKTAWNSVSCRRFLVNNIHPGLIDLFVDQVRKEAKTRTPSVLQSLKCAPSNRIVKPKKETQMER